MVVFCNLIDSDKSSIVGSDKQDYVTCNSSYVLKITAAVSAGPGKLLPPLKTTCLY